MNSFNKKILSLLLEEENQNQNQNQQQQTNNNQDQQNQQDQTSQQSSQSQQQKDINITLFNKDLLKEYIINIFQSFLSSHQYNRLSVANVEIKNLNNNESEGNIIIKWDPVYDIKNNLQEGKGSLTNLNIETSNLNNILIKKEEIKNIFEYKFKDSNDPNKQHVINLEEINLTFNLKTNSNGKEYNWLALIINIKPINQLIQNNQLKNINVFDLILSTIKDKVNADILLNIINEVLKTINLQQIKADHFNINSDLKQFNLTNQNKIIIPIYVIKNE